MRDKRPVDELSIEELERILAIKKREARQAQLERMKRDGRIVTPAPVKKTPPVKSALTAGTVESDVVTPPPIVSSAVPRFEDDPDSLYAVKKRDPNAELAWRRFINRALLLVEVAAVFGLLSIGFLLLQAQTELRDTTEREQQIARATREAAIPTLEPTAVLRVNVNDWVLPGGHTFIQGNNGELIPIQNLAELEEANIPSHLLPAIQDQVLTTRIERPARTPETALAISIPALGLDEPIVQGSDWEALRSGVGQVLNGARPGDETGNVVLAAHNDIYGELFRDLDQLQPGDTFTIRTERHVYTYRVVGTDIVEPHQVEVMQNTGLPTATLISCYPYRVNTHRYVVYAERVDL
ncbi:MAG: hypothetical protein CUN56_05235 [Phototrophicales bacterium]|nr:MAG: hypothetical protein CUN56_05235 [Phototrophicales bacterium]RMG72384.1 MAG: class D sortase [Chloroflexota bacterium]